MHDQGYFSGFKKLFGNIHNAYVVGQKQWELGLLGYKALMGNATKEDYAKIEQIKKELSRPGGSDGFLEPAATMVGQMSGGFPGIFDAFVSGGIGGSLAALLLGQAGPQAAFPEEIFTMPAAFWFAGSRTAAVDIADQARVQGAGHAFLELTDTGVDVENAAVIAHSVGLVNGLLEVVGVKIVTAPVRKLISEAVMQNVKKRMLGATKNSAMSNALKAYAKAVSGETGTEIAQEIVNITAGEIARAIDPKELESLFATEEGRDQLVDRMFQTIKEVTQGVSVLALLGVPASYYSGWRQATNSDVNQAEETAKFLETYGELAKNSKMPKEVIQEFFEKLATGSPVTHLYMDAREFKAHFESQGLDPAEMAQKLSLTREQFEAAVNASHDLGLPIHFYLAEFASTEHHAALSRHIRSDPSHMTLAEVEQSLRETDEAPNDAGMSNEVEDSD